MSAGEYGTQAGAIYDLASAKWRKMATAGAPSARVAPAVWTGSKLAVWGGHSSDTTDGIDCREEWYKSSSSCPLFQDGALYDVTSDSWTPMGDAGAPAPRYDHLLGWTGDRILVWGGKQPGTYDPVTNFSDPDQLLKDGGLYDINTKTWTATAPSSFPFDKYPTTYSVTSTGDRVLLKVNSRFDAWLFDARTNTWTALPAPNPGDYCWYDPVVQAGAVVTIGQVGGVQSAVLLLPGETSWRSFPLPPNAPTGSLLWTGKRLFMWGGTVSNPGCGANMPAWPVCDPPPPVYGNTGWMLIP